MWCLERTRDVLCPLDEAFTNTCFSLLHQILTSLFYHVGQDNLHSSRWAIVPSSTDSCNPMFHTFTPTSHEWNCNDGIDWLTNVTGLSILFQLSQFRRNIRRSMWQPFFAESVPEHRASNNISSYLQDIGTPIAQGPNTEAYPDYDTLASPFLNGTMTDFLVPSLDNRGDGNLGYQPGYDGRHAHASESERSPPSSSTPPTGTTAPSSASSTTTDTGPATPPPPPTTSHRATATST